MILSPFMFYASSMVKAINLILAKHKQTKNQKAIQKIALKNRKKEEKKDILFHFLSFLRVGERERRKVP